MQEDEGPKDEDPETNEKNGRLYDKAGKIRKMKHEQVNLPLLLKLLLTHFAVLLPKLVWENPPHNSYIASSFLSFVEMLCFCVFST